MTSGLPNRDWSTMVDPYLDGMLSTEDAASFEARLREDAVLRGEVEAQGAIDAVLRERFAVPEGVESAAGTAVAASGHTGGVGSPARRSVLARIGWVRIAAVFVVAMLGVYLYYLRSYPASVIETESPIAAYQSIVRGGFRPYEVCTDDAEFAKYTQRYLGQALGVKPFQGLALIGWDNRHNVMSLETDSLLATVDGTQVVVFMDHDSNARSMPKTGEGLHVFKRTVGGIVLVEVSPLAEAKVLPGFVVVKQ